MATAIKKILLSCLVMVLGIVPAISQPLTQVNEVNTDNSNSSSSVAIVNGQSITESQLEVASRSLLAGIEDPEAQKRIKLHVLNQLIDQSLVSQAIKDNAKLLRDEDLIQIDLLKQQALFNFYLSKLVGYLPSPKINAIDDYIHNHPDQFENRKTYHFTQFLIDSTNPKVFDSIKIIVKHEGGLSALSVWLNQEKISYTHNNVWFGTEQISSSNLQILNQLKINGIDLRINPNKNLIQIIQLQGVYPDPMSIEDARSGIMRGVTQEIIDKASKTALATLRAKADIKIQDEVLAKVKESPEEVPLSPYLNITDVSFFSKIIAVWCFSLLVLAPACALDLYRDVTSEKLHRDSALSDNLLAAPHPLLDIKDMRIPLLLILPIILLIPFIQFILSPPTWITTSRSIDLFLTAICFSAFIILLFRKIRSSWFIFNNKWAPTMLLLGIEIGILLAT